MKPNDFEVYQKLLKDKSGLVLTPDKAYLLDSRLSPVAKDHGFEDLEKMTESLRGVPDQKMVNAIIEAMTTNETSFFRDMRPFDMFKETVLPFLAENNAATRSFKLWCAASSSGQEPYSLAMILKEDPRFAGWNIQIDATDISHDILDLARTGLYSQFEVQRGLPIQLLMKYFTQVEDKWQISDEIKAMVNYGYFNLLESMTMLPTYDVVFCRNVLIYFDETTKKMVLENMIKQMTDKSFLFLGGAETVLGITEAFKPVPDKRGLYAPDGSPHLEKAA